MVFSAYRTVKLPPFARHEYRWVTLAFLACALLLTTPLLRHPTSLFGEADAWQFLWNFDHVGRWLSGADDLFRTGMLHWPAGISLVFHTLSLSNALPAQLFIPVFGLVGTYNLLIYLHFVGAGLAMYVLARHLVRSPLAAFVAGYLFTFSPYHLMRSTGHLNLFSTEGIPLYIYFLWRMRERPSWRMAGGALAALVYTGYADLYLLLFLFVFTLLFVLYALLTRTSWRFYRTLALVGIATALILTPMLYPLLTEKFTTTTHEVISHDPARYSADALSFFIPGIHSAYRDWTAPFWQNWSGTMESTTYIGWTVIVLAAFALWRRRREPSAWFWGVTAVIFFVLALGPYLHVNGVIHYDITLPYSHLLDIRLLAIGGVVTRFAMMGSMALAVLVAFTLHDLNGAFRRGWLVPFVVFLVAAVELWPARIPASAVSVPEFYRTLAADTEQYAIADLSDAPAKVLYYQTVHGKPLVGGYTSRPTVPTQQQIATTPVIADLYGETPLTRDVVPPADGPRILESLRIRYILVPTENMMFRLYLERLRLPVEYSSEAMTVYRVY